MLTTLDGKVISVAWLDSNALAEMETMPSGTTTAPFALCHLTRILPRINASLWLL